MDEPVNEAFDEAGRPSVEELAEQTALGDEAAPDTPFADMSWVAVDGYPGMKVAAPASNYTIDFHGKTCLLLKHIWVGHAHMHLILSRCYSNT
jgi:hypothetical protein